MLSYQQLQRIVYETVAEPPQGYKVGEVVTGLILTLIAVNVIVGVLETEDHLYVAAPDFFYYFEFVSVIIFTVEYVSTIWSCTVVEIYASPFSGRIKAMLRPMSIVDILAIAPFYLSLALASSDVDLRFVRILRLFRLFRLFRNGKLSRAFKALKDVITSKQEQLGLGMSILILSVLLCSSIMYIIETELSPEGSATKFTSIPASMWWGIVTMTTIGYGDMVPQSAVGKIFASFVGYLGICAIALPVGIIGAGFTDYMNKEERKHDDACHDRTDKLQKTVESDRSYDINLKAQKEEQIQRLKTALLAIEEAIRIVEDSMDDDDDDEIESTSSKKHIVRWKEDSVNEYYSYSDYDKENSMIRTPPLISENDEVIMTESNNDRV